MSEHEHHHQIEIIVNTREKLVPPGTVTFEQIIELAFGGPLGPNENATIDWSIPGTHKHGTLVRDQKLAVEKGMDFVVTRSNQS